jgi:thymidylate synthase ThyX
MKLSFRKDLHIATLRSESMWNKFKIHTLLQNSEAKQPSINTYLGARYSRSADSIIDIASEIVKNNTDAAERLEKIFAGYGHKSVGDMADLFVCIENIPMTVAMRIFYTCPVVSGQERSTRYQNFQNPDFVKIPKEVCEDRELRKEYERIMLKQFKDYRELLGPTKEALQKFFKINEDSTQETSALKARAFDTARYLLPYGHNTSSAYLMSARSWSDLISLMCASDSVVDNEVSNLLLNILGDSNLEARGYIKEADGLIRHTDANCCRKDSTQRIIELIGKELSREQVSDLPESETEAIKISYSPDCMEALLSHYEGLLNPLGSKKEFEFSENDQERIGEIIFEKHDHHNQLGNIGQSGAVKIEGFASLGTLKDLNRHRSMERFVPLLHDHIDMDQELGRRNDQCYYLCNYLEINSFNKLRKEYEAKLDETYERIREWRKMAKERISKEVCDEYTKYMLPYAHSTRYIYYGSFDDLQYVINLRTRNGGHISYRKLTYEWLRSLTYIDPIWRPLLKKIIEPKIDDKHQFVDRS